MSEQLLLLSGLLRFVEKLVNIEIPHDRRHVGNAISEKIFLRFTYWFREKESMG